VAVTWAVWLMPSKSVTVTRHDLTAIRSGSLSHSLFLRYG
jgi:hypothetical protein